jgi:branched-chain amino acid aminotransferase
MSTRVYVDGEFRSEADATVSVFDHGLLYGDGVFEGIRAYNSRVFKLERHVERLFDSAKAIRLEIPLSPDDMTAAVVETCARNAIVDGYIRVVVTRGAGDLGIDPRGCKTPRVIVITKPSLVFYRPAANGLTMVTSSLRRPSPDSLSPSIKSLNYLNNVLARIEANDRGADEALMLDAQGCVAEASADNLFIGTASGLHTPPTTNTLQGITRETVMEIAQSLGIPCLERPITLFDVWSAREAFVCGTGAEVVPVRSVDGRTIGDGTVGARTERTIQAYAELVRSTGTPIASKAGIAVSVSG